MSVTRKRDGFFKSSYSNDGTGCVEVSFDGVQVRIRDSKYVGDAQQQPTIIYPTARWSSVLELVLSAKAGTAGSLAIELRNDGSAAITGEGPSGQTVALDYTPQEWDAFAKGVVAGEFVVLQH